MSQYTQNIQANSSYKQQMNNSLYALLKNDKDLDINQMIDSKNISNNINMISAARNSSSMA